MIKIDLKLLKWHRKKKKTIDKLREKCYKYDEYFSICLYVIRLAPDLISIVLAYSVK